MICKKDCRCYFCVNDITLIKVTKMSNLKHLSISELRKEIDRLDEANGCLSMQPDTEGAINNNLTRRKWAVKYLADKEGTHGPSCDCFECAEAYKNYMPPVRPEHLPISDDPQSALDKQVDGDHYKTPIQPIEYIHANDIGFCEGNVIKYVSRWKKKNGLADLEKAKHYIELLIQLETEKGDDNESNN